MKYAVHITADLVNPLWRFDSCRCPVAQAMERAAPRPNCFWTVSPHSTGGWCANSHKVDGVYENPLTIMLPSEAALFAARFDSGHSVEPVSFEIEVPE